MPPDYRYLLLRHDHPTSLQWETHTIGGAAAHSRWEAAHKLPKGAFFAATLQHDGGDIPAQRDQGSSVIRRAFIAALCQ